MKLQRQGVRSSLDRIKTSKSGAMPARAPIHSACRKVLAVLPDWAAAAPMAAWLNGSITLSVGSMLSWVSAMFKGKLRAHHIKVPRIAQGGKQRLSTR